MSAWRYPELKRYANKKGACAVCGRHAKRTRVFTNTLNPFNRNPDGSIRTQEEIYALLSEQAEAWKAAPVTHAGCES